MDLECLQGQEDRNERERCVKRKNVAVLQREFLTDVLRLLCGVEAKNAHDPSEQQSGIFVQKRVGEEGKNIHVVKIATMKPDADTQYEAVLHHYGLDAVGRLKHDPRVTPLGQILRTYKIDELPQVLQWLSGYITGRRVFSWLGIRPKPKTYWRKELGKENEGDGTIDATIDRYTRFRPGLLSIDYALPPDALYEDRLALWQEYVECCERMGQTKANLRFAPRLLCGIVRRWVRHLQKATLLPWPNRPTSSASPAITTTVPRR